MNEVLDWLVKNLPGNLTGLFVISIAVLVLAYYLLKAINAFFEARNNHALKHDVRVSHLADVTRVVRGVAFAKVRPDGPTVHISPGILKRDCVSGVREGDVLSIYFRKEPKGFNATRVIPIRR
jgi:hypothetical protein